MRELFNSVIVVFLVLVAQPLGADGRVVLGSQFLLIVYSILTVISCISVSVSVSVSHHGRSEAQHCE